MPQLISVPMPFADYTTLEDGKNYWSDLTDNFFTPTSSRPATSISPPWRSWPRTRTTCSSLLRAGDDRLTARPGRPNLEKGWWHG